MKEGLRPIFIRTVYSDTDTTTTTTTAVDIGKRICTVGLESSLALVVLVSPLGASVPLSPTMLLTDGVVEHEVLGP